MFLKKSSLIFIILILLIFAVLTYQGVKSTPDTLKIKFFNYPLKILEQGISTFTKGIKNFFKSYVLVVGKKDEYIRLTERVKKIEQEKNQCLEAKYENDRLRELLELKLKKANYVATAEVFSRDPTNWFQVLWINKGIDDSISKDMIAVTPVGAVGRIHSVLENRANIILITDINSSVAVRIQSSRVDGILEGNGDNKCYLKYVPQDVDVEIGEKIITSGLDGIYPEGLQIGYVTDVKKESGEFFQVIEVTPAQNLNAVEEVAVLRR